MKVTFEAKVTTNIQHENDPKTGDPQYQSKLEWSRSKWSTDSIWVNQFVPLGTKVTVTCEWETPQSDYGIDHDILVRQQMPEAIPLPSVPGSPLNDLDDEEAKALQNLVEPQTPPH